MVVNGIQYCLYVDSGYSLRTFREVPFQGSNLTPSQRALKVEMSRARVTVEWAFEEVKLYWTTVDFKRKMCIAESPVEALYLADMQLTNMPNCIYPSSISHYFRCLPLSLDGYLNKNASPPAGPPGCGRSPHLAPPKLGTTALRARTLLVALRARSAPRAPSAPGHPRHFRTAKACYAFSKPHNT